MKRQRKRRTQRPIVKDMSLTTLILTLIFMALVAVYQLTTSDRDRNLSEELNTLFATYKK